MIIGGILKNSIFGLIGVPLSISAQAIATLLNLSGSRGIITGTGPLKDDRTSTQTVINSDGVLQTLPAGTVTFENARYVINTFANYSNIAAWNKRTANVQVVNNACIVTGFTDLASFKNTVESGDYTGIFGENTSGLPAAGRSYAYMFWACAESNVNITVAPSSWSGHGSSTINRKVLSVTTTPKLFCVKQTYASDAVGPPFIDIWINSVNLTVFIGRMCRVDITNNVSAVPEIVDSTVIYNAGIAGARVFDTANANTVDANGVVTEVVGAPLAVKPRIVAESSAINLFVNPLTPATQTIALAAGTYSIYIRGTGSIVLSGGATGTVTSAAKLTFTTTGSTTFTVSGTVTACNVVAGDRQSSLITATSRAANQLNLPRVGNMRSDRGLFAFRFKRGYTGEPHINSLAEVLLQSTGINILTKLANSDTYRASDGTNNADLVVTGNMTDVICELHYDQALGIMQWGALHVGSGSFAFSPVTAFNGFTFTADILRLYQTIGTRIEHIALKSYDAVPQAAAGFAATRAWIEANLVAELAP